ncbi:hypothetical protein CEXT_69781 [Caerostris extrusa]|uniref:LAGLIDADG homing endonuclease n=1 Tax=Caerostris extrusa TaxID=172846 RepID=A0AAV4NWX8_CAEEX|nr:hypothetical protein CEXT_69781 [Caerostris extrusa]
MKLTKLEQFIFLNFHLCAIVDSLTSRCLLPNIIEWMVPYRFRKEEKTARKRAVLGFARLNEVRQREFREFVDFKVSAKKYFFGHGDLRSLFGLVEWDCPGTKGILASQECSRILSTGIPGEDLCV